MRALHVLGLGGVVAAAACGNPYKEELERNRNFQCNDRTASYVVMGGLAARELGVMIDCRDAGPRIVQWKADQDGTRDEQTQSLTVSEFERVWEKIDSSGWRYLEDCASTGGDDDPAYSFDVNDWNGHAEFACTNAGPLPYPYNVMVDQLDLLAAEKAKRDTSTKKDPDDP